MKFRMRQIKSYQNENAVQSALDNKELVKPYVAFIEDGQYIDWNGKDIDYSKMYLTFEALEDGSFFFKKEQYYTRGDICYSVNDGEWVTGTTGNNYINNIKQGDKVRFKGSITASRDLFSGVWTRFKAYGNLLSIVYGDNFIGETRGIGFTNLFKSSWLIDASNLILPTENMHFVSMFYYCVSMTIGPVLPVAIMTTQSYYGMFEDCQSLKYIKCLGTNPGTDASSPTYGWVSGVSATGTFVKKAGVEWPIGQHGIPSGWTVIEE